MGAPVNNFARIRTTDGLVNYRLTADDVLWSARAASREGPDTETSLILWTFTQRFVLYNLKSGLTYQQVLRSFSQPVNPIWAANGSMCKVGGKYHDSDYCSPARLAARKKAATATWDQLQADYPTTMEMVTKWAVAEVPNPVPRVTNFSDPTVAKSYLTKNPTSELFDKSHGNWFIVDPAPAKWPSDYVFMEPPTVGSSLLSSLWQGATNWWKA